LDWWLTPGKFAKLRKLILRLFSLHGIALRYRPASNRLAGRILQLQERCLAGQPKAAW
jgi:hypothetical protein